MVNTCIFDLDGVIVDTAKYHFLAWSALARKLGFEFTEQHNEALKGVSRMRSLDILLEVGNMLSTFSDTEKALLADDKNNLYVSYINKMDRSEILPGVEDFINDIRNQGIKVALGSASKNARMILTKTGITDLFDVVVDGTMVSAAKPDPQVFLLGAQLTGAHPQHCVVFEDAEAGVEAAHRAGMKCVGVGGSPLLAKADVLIDGFEKLKLKNLNL